MDHWTWKMPPADAFHEGGAMPAAAEQKRFCPGDKQVYSLQEYLSWACEPGIFGSEAEAMLYWDTRMTPVKRNVDEGNSWRWATNLLTIDWQGATLVRVEKDFYTEHPNVKNRAVDLVAEIKRSRSIEVVDHMGRLVPNPVTTFEEAAFPDWLMEKLQRKPFQEPTPIQMQTWPVALQGRDLIGIAETGSGKTLAYLLPMIVHIMAQPELKAGEGPVGVVLCPTRELAMQIDSVCREYAGQSGISCTCVYGGGSVRDQGNALLAKNDIITATPGRFIQMLNDRWTNLNRVTYVVLDEADVMLQEGFEEQVKLILSQIRPDRQVLMFSATWSKDVQQLSIQHCQVEPVTVRIGGDYLAACIHINQKVLVTDDNDKRNKLLEAFERAGVGRRNDKHKVLIFCKSISNVDMLRDFLWSRNIQAGVMHSEKDQKQRIAALHDFKNGDMNVMVATDCLGRGHDIPSVRYVINYDAPYTIESYIHQIGRTGRAGERGHAMTFVTNRDVNLVLPLIGVLKRSGATVSPALQDLASWCKSFPGCSTPNLLA